MSFEIVIRRKGFDGSYAIGGLDSRAQAEEAVRLLKALTFPADQYEVRRIRSPR